MSKMGDQPKKKKLKTSKLSGFDFRCPPKLASVKPKGHTEAEFLPKWLIEFQWLYQNEAGAMMCRYCKAENKNTVFGKNGSTKYQHSALTRH